MVAVVAIQARRTPTKLGRVAAHRILTPHTTTRARRFAKRLDLHQFDYDWKLITSELELILAAVQLSWCWPQGPSLIDSSLAFFSPNNVRANLGRCIGMFGSILENATSPFISNRVSL